MSSYWTIYKNVPAGRVWDELPWEEQEKCMCLGMFDGTRWDRQLTFKTTSSHFTGLAKMFDPDASGMFAIGDGMTVHLAKYMNAFAGILERVPKLVEEFEGDIVVQPFFLHLGPTLRQIQKEQPDGRGYAIVMR